MIILNPIAVSAPGAFVSSNVLEADHPTYNPATAYAVGAKVIDLSTHAIYESKVAANTGNALTDTTKWLFVSATNRWKMLDSYNNTQTENPESIALVMKSSGISQGLYLGNLDANEVTVTVTDEIEGEVYAETQSLVIADSGGSFFNWCFKPIRRKTYFVTTRLPVYANATIAVTISKPGAIAKCGMFALGPLIDVGLSEMGLSTEIKDFSSTTFNFDGTSSSVVRGYAKRMSVEVEVDNQLIDSVQEQLADFRQKTVVFLGSVRYGSAMICGKYSSFKNVISGLTKSRMALQIEGVV